MPNPLLHPQQMPTFSDIIPKEHIESALEEILADYESNLTQLLQQKIFTWDNFVIHLDVQEERLDNMWTAVSYLNKTIGSDELRAIYERGEAKIAEFKSKLLQNVSYYQAIRSIADADDFTSLPQAQQKAIKLLLDDFNEGGIDLPQERKQRLVAINEALSIAEALFMKNTQLATDAWTLHVTNQDDLKGLPDSDLQNAAALAVQKNQEGWIITLKQTVYQSAMKLIENRSIRQQMYTAYWTRASDQGPHAGRWNNGPVIEEILKLRHEKAQLLGFQNFAELSVSKKMAKDTTRVTTFLNDLAKKSRPAAEREIAELKTCAKQDGIEDFQLWDLSFYAEKLRKQKYNISQEEIRPYLPLEKVRSGYFTILNKLYGITVREAQYHVDTWHDDVKYFEVYDEENAFRGGVYMDLYARDTKQSGAWTTSIRTRMKMPDGSVRFPIVILSTNFAQPQGDAPSLLTEANVKSLFHEFGHCLHHVLTKMEVRAVSGFNGVPCDALEFPSQIMELFICNAQTIKLISGHYQDNAPLPDNLYEGMLAAKRFLPAISMLTQLEYGLIDFMLHLQYDTVKGARTLETLTSIQKSIAVLSPPLEANRMPWAYNHVFGGPYAAGYYSYKWSEILTHDAFSRFKEAGILSEELGRDYMHKILEQGGMPDFLEAFKQFCGREPKIEALMHNFGLEEQVNMAASFFKRKVSSQDEASPPTSELTELEEQSSSSSLSSLDDSRFDEEVPFFDDDDQMSSSPELYESRSPSP